MNVRIVPIEDKKMIQAVNKDKLSKMLSQIEYFDRVNKIAYMKDGREISFDDVKKNTGMFDSKEKKEFMSMITTLDTHYSESDKKSKKHKKEISKLKNKMKKVKKQKPTKKNIYKVDELKKKFEKISSDVKKNDKEKERFIPNNPLLYNTKAKDGIHRLATLTGKKLNSKTIDVLKSQRIRVKHIFVFFPMGPNLQHYTLIPIKSFLKFGDYKKVTVKVNSYTNDKKIGGRVEFEFKTLAEVLYFFRNTNHVLQETVHSVYKDQETNPYVLNTEIESITVKMKNGKEKVIDKKQFMSTHKSAFESMERIEE